MIERGKFNEIHSRFIDADAIISGWSFIGKNCQIGRVRLGNYVEINSGCIIGDGTNLQPRCILNSDTRVGKNCMFGGNVITADEKYLTPYTESVNRTPCEIGDNVMIGVGSILICCKIGNNSIVGAGSLVLNDIPDDEVWIGSPAKYLMKRSEYDEKQKEFLK